MWKVAFGDKVEVKKRDSIKRKMRLKVGGCVLVIGIIFLSIHLRSIDKSKRITLWVGEVPLRVEVKDTPEGRKQGLMFRKELPEKQGMLFVFEEPGIYPFWMKDTYIPLSIAFISANGEIVQIDSMAPLDTLNFHFPSKPIKYAIEVNQGWFECHKIKVGDRIKGLP